MVARGTLFDVDMTHPALQVTLYRGAVDVRMDTHNGRPAMIRRLVPGQRIAQADRTGELTIAAAPAGQDDWVSGILSFAATPLRQVVTQTNRYSTSQIEVDPSVADIKVDGTFRVGDNDDLIRSLAAALHLSAKSKSNGDWELGPA